MWTADELFMTGTAAEVTPVREVDGRRIGSGEPGPVTRRLQDRFFAVVSGKDPAHADWFTPV
jgi:branched-chain amino acid aminotransferase